MDALTEAVDNLVELARARETELARARDAVECYLTAGDYDTVCPADRANCSGHARVPGTDEWIPCPNAHDAGCPWHEEQQQRRNTQTLLRVGFGSRVARTVLDWQRVPDDVRVGVRGWCDVMQQHISAGNGLLLTGPPGTGKTCALGLMALAAAEQRANVAYVTCADLLDAMYSEAGRERVEAWRHCELLMIDDIGTGYGSPFGRAGFAALVDARYRDCRCTVATSNVSLEQLARVDWLARSVDRWRETQLWLCTSGTSQRVPAGGDTETAAWA